MHFTFGIVTSVIIVSSLLHTSTEAPPPYNLYSLGGDPTRTCSNVPVRMQHPDSTQLTFTIDNISYTNLHIESSGQYCISLCWYLYSLRHAFDFDSSKSFPLPLVQPTHGPQHPPVCAQQSAAPPPASFVAVNRRRTY